MAWLPPPSAALKVRENTQNYGYIHPGVEKDRSPDTVGFLHQVPPGERQQRKDCQEAKLIGGVVDTLMHQGENKHDQKI